MKMYIFVKEELPLGYKAVAIAHASLICYLNYHETDSFKEWLKSSFKKVICEVDNETFEKIKNYPDDNVIITESSLNNKEVAICFAPMKIIPTLFKIQKLLGD